MVSGLASMRDIDLRGQQRPQFKDNVISVYGDGSIGSLKQYMRECGISHAVVKNVASSPENVMAANTWAIEVAKSERCIFPLGSLHLKSDDYEREIEVLSQCGIKGATFNSSWQGFDMDRPDMMGIYRALAKAGLFAMFHVGTESLPFANHHTTQRTILNIVMAVPELKVVAAHMGVGTEYAALSEYEGIPNVWIDLAYMPEHISLLRTLSADELKHLIMLALEKVGPDRVLYGSDYPWTDPGSHIAFYQQLGLSPEIMDDIYFSNAARLLGISDATTAIQPAKPATINVEGFQSNFNGFKQETVAKIGNAYMIALAPEYLEVIERYSRQLNVDPQLLMFCGPIIAALANKDNQDVLAFLIFNVEAWSGSINRAITLEEANFLRLMNVEIAKAGFNEIPHLADIPGVTIFDGDGNVVTGNKGKRHAKTPGRIAAVVTRLLKR